MREHKEFEVGGRFDAANLKFFSHNYHYLLSKRLFK